MPVVCLLPGKRSAKPGKTLARDKKLLLDGELVVNGVRAISCARHLDGCIDLGLAVQHADEPNITLRRLDSDIGTFERWSLKQGGLDVRRDVDIRNVGARLGSRLGPGDSSGGLVAPPQDGRHGNQGSALHQKSRAGFHVGRSR